MMCQVTIGQLTCDMSFDMPGDVTDVSCDISADMSDGANINLCECQSN